MKPIGRCAIVAALPKSWRNATVLAVRHLADHAETRQLGALGVSCFAVTHENSAGRRVEIFLVE
jgi:hypothetical protein